MIYLALLSICLIIGIVLRVRGGIHLYHSFKEELIFITVLLALFIPMDIYAVKHGVWEFPGNGILGLYILGLPIEEYLFMLVIPYFVLVVYKFIDNKFSQS